MYWNRVVGSRDMHVCTSATVSKGGRTFSQLPLLLLLHLLQVTFEDLHSPLEEEEEGLLLGVCLGEGCAQLPVCVCVCVDKKLTDTRSL